MKKPLRIINIDGTDGVGKTTQINMLALSLKKLGNNVLVLNLEDNIDSATECMEKTKVFLDKHPEGLVINDGSIARMMVMDMVSGMMQNDIMSKYRNMFHEYEVLSHQHGTANVLMVMEDTAECHKRILRRGELANTNENGIKDFALEQDIVKGMRFFDVNVISKNLKFHVLDIEQHESIMEVQDDLIEYLEDNFDVDMKKPS